MKQFWINLPIKNLLTSKNFYNKIGFRENPQHINATHLGSFFIGEQKTVMMLFEEKDFSHFCQHKVSDTTRGTEILLNIDAQSREEVDEMAVLVTLAGGTIFAEPGESQGWMYAFGFSDPDGHRWSMLYMDMEKMPK